MKELGHDVECEEVAVDPLSAHRCLQQSLVLIHRQAEQGEALWVLGSPGRSQVMEKQEMGLLLGPVTHPWPQPSLQHPCKAEIATLFYRGDSGSKRGRRLPRATQQGRIMGSQVRLTLLKRLPVNRTGSGGDRTAVPGVFPAESSYREREEWCQWKSQVTQRLNNQRATLWNRGSL